MSDPREFFYYDENGNPQDAALHDPVLAAGDEAAAFWGSTYHVLKRHGWTEYQIERAYPELYAKGR